MIGNDKKRKLQVRFFVCLFFLFLCGILSSCQGGREHTGNGEETLSVWFFACSEDADSILLQTDDTNVIIDTGVEADSPELLEKLERLQVDNIDLMILTHPDKDHIGGADELLERFPVEQVIQTDYAKGSKEQSELNEKLAEKLPQEDILVPEEVTQLTFGELQITVYPPMQEYDSSNNNSIAVLAEYEGKRFFFAGDAKKKRIDELLEEGLGQVDVYKVAHHGRDNGRSDDLIRVLQPDIAVVTAAGPEEETKKALSDVGADIYSTYETDVHFTVSDGILDGR